MTDTGLLPPKNHVCYIPTFSRSPVADGAQPYLRGLSDTEKEMAIATALRSLVSRELIEVTNIEQLDDLMRQQEATDAAGQNASHRTPVDMNIAQEAAIALNLRRTAERALAAELNTSAGMSHAFVYIHSADLFLIERVTTGGLHLFTLTNSIESAAEIVQDLVDPFGVADKDGRSRRLDPHALDSANVGSPLQQVIDGALVVGRLMVLSDSPGALVITYAAEREVWTVTVDEPHAPTGIVAQAIGAKSLGRKIADLLRTPE